MKYAIFAILFLWWIPGADAAYIRSIQHGTSTIAANSATSTATIRPVDTTKSFVIGNYTVDDATSGGAKANIQLTNSSTITLNRSDDATSSVIVQWFVPEFTNNVTVQRGSTSMTGTSTISISLTPVATTSSFVVMSNKSGGTAVNNDDFIEGHLFNSSTLVLSLKGNGGAPSIVEWQVVEYTDSLVESGTHVILPASTTMSLPISAATSSKSWIVFSTATYNQANNDMGEKMINAELLDAETISFSRRNTGVSTTISWFLVKFTDATIVQTGEFNMGTASTTQISTLASSSINLSRSVLAAGGETMHGSGKCSMSTNDNLGACMARMEFLDKDTIEATRALTGGGTFTVQWFAIEFPRRRLLIVD